MSLDMSSRISAPNILRYFSEVLITNLSRTYLSARLIFLAIFNNYMIFSYNLMNKSLMKVPTAVNSNFGSLLKFKNYKIFFQSFANRPMSKARSTSSRSSNKLTQFNKNQKAEDIRLTNIAAAKCTPSLLGPHPLSIGRCGQDFTRPQRHGQNDPGRKSPGPHHQRWGHHPQEDFCGPPDCQDGKILPTKFF